MELLRWPQFSRGPRLTFADHEHELDPDEGHRSRSKGLEPQMATFELDRRLLVSQGGCR
jgi:hypothetical protein